MPELPDLAVYKEALERRLLGQPLVDVRLANPFLLRTVDPPLAAAKGQLLRRIELLGKRLVFTVDGDVHLLLHLMIAGRLHWKGAGAALKGRNTLAGFDFPKGTLVLTEAGTKRRASLHLARGEEGLAAYRPGGLEPLGASIDDLRAALTAENRTLKRALTTPRIISGVGNAYSDEILHAARLSPMKLTRSLTDEELGRLHAALESTLHLWIDRLRAETGDGFPEKVTAFRPEMAVHGKYRQPCPRCGAPVQRIVYAENEANYCAKCQTGGRLLADRALSRLLKDDWPRTLDELEQHKQERRDSTNRKTED